MSETWRPFAVILFCRPSNYVQNAVEKSKIGPVVFELQSAPYCELAFLLKYRYGRTAALGEGTRFERT